MSDNVVERLATCTTSDMQHLDPNRIHRHVVTQCNVAVAQKYDRLKLCCWVRDLSDFTARDCIKSLVVHERRVAEPCEKVPAESFIPLRVHITPVRSDDLGTVSHAPEQHEPIRSCHTVMQLEALLVQH